MVTAGTQKKDTGGRVKGANRRTMYGRCETSHGTSSVCVSIYLNTPKRADEQLKDSSVYALNSLARASRDLETTIVVPVSYYFPI